MAYQTRAIIVNRRVSTLSYFGGISLLVIALRPRSRYAARHASVAAGLQLIRFAWATLTIVVWSLNTNMVMAHPGSRLGLDLGMLLIAGIPWPVGIDIHLALALSLPLGVTWALGLIGAVLAATGHTVDLESCFHSDWSGDMQYPDDEFTRAPRYSHKNRAEDRSRVKELTEQRLDRIWQASQVAAMEHRRADRLDKIRTDQDAVLSRIANLNRMLSLGEISLTRFNSVYSELIDYLNVLRMETSNLELRRVDVFSLGDQGPRPPTVDHIPETRVLTLAIVDPSGLPILTYGHFSVDESMITGMISVFESLSEEMFGSAVHKTQLADGQVIHFVRGRMTIAYAIFEDEPAAEQIFRLREFHENFESLNEDSLRVLPIDPSRLRDLASPFDFVPSDVQPEVEKPQPKPYPLRQFRVR
ncbi:MAG TPA: hypothetical protein VHV31_15550 [Nitrolancea sp.]|nr:hypothetical protein [Nitrolancea sp.]